MGFDLGSIGRIANVAVEVANIGMSLLGGLQGGGQAQQAKPAAPADMFQAAAPQQQAAMAGKPADFGNAITQILDTLKQIAGLLGQLGGGQGQAQAPAVGVGNQAGGTPAQTGGAAPQAPAPQAGAPAPQAGAPTQQAGAPAPQAGGVAPQGGVNPNQVLIGTGKILEGAGILLQALGQGSAIPGTPSPDQNGSLSTSAGSSAVTTPGGYKIECESATTWKITGPDGKSTKIHGDPHISTGDGENFDFYKNSAFTLPDGTKITCQTKDVGNGTTLSDKLEITNNGNRVLMEGLAEGKGKVTQMGKGPETIQSAQTFNMLGEADDWGLNGSKEEIAKHTGKDQYQLKNGAAGPAAQPAATAQAQAGAGAGAANGAGQTAPAGGAQQQQGGLQGLLNQIQQMLAALTGQQAAAQPAQTQPAQQAQQTQPAQQTQQAQQAQPQRPGDVLAQLLQSIVGMLNALLPLLGGNKPGGPVAA